MAKQPHMDSIRQNINRYLENPANDGKILFLDTETTGLGDTDQAISIAIVDEDLTVIINTRLNTTVAISPEAQKIHKISKDDLADYPYFTDIEQDIRKLLDGRKVGIYNADFDTRIINQSATAPIDNYTAFCVMNQAMRHFDSDRWLKLVNVCDRLDIELSNAHDALADVIATVQVWRKINAVLS